MFFFFHWVSFKSLFLPSAPTVEFSLCLCRVLFHGVGQVPSCLISVLALHPLFLQCVTQIPHFFFGEATRIENGIMAHFPPKICFKYILTHSRGLWFKLEYIFSTSWFSEGGQGVFHEAQICRKKIYKYLMLLQAFFSVLGPKWKLLWIEDLWMLLQIKNVSANKERGT